MAAPCKYGRIIYTVAGILLGGIAIWSAQAGVALPLVGFAVIAALFSFGGTVNAVRESVPRYQQTGLLALGAVATALLALGYRREFLLGFVVVGAAALVDLFVRQRRGAGRESP